MSFGNSAAPVRSVTRCRALAPVLGAVALVASIAVIVVSGVSTSSARIAGTTEADGFLSAGTVVVSQATDDTALLFDADGLYPGAEITGCVAIRYEGSVPAALRLTASLDDGSGLDRFIEIRLIEKRTGACPDADATASETATDTATRDPGAGTGGRVLYDGNLRAFWQTNRSYSTGLEIAGSMTAGDIVVVEATVTVVDDNRAAGLDTEVTFVFESRPA